MEGPLRVNRELRIFAYNIWMQFQRLLGPCLCVRCVVVMLVVVLAGF
jgi:hypothetical protein